jgi:hypothetical protein
MAELHEPKVSFDRASILAGALLLVGACLPTDRVAAEPAVDLELILAVDVSGSMSRADLLIQRHGYIAALRSAEVGAAIAFRGGIALAYVEWAGPKEQRIVVPWIVIADVGDAETFVERLAGAPLNPSFGSPPQGTGTSISEALLFAADMFSSNGASRTIDVSGNGPNNSGGSLADARESVVARGIAINGLPIVRADAPFSEFPLVIYYEDCVIGGPGAFAVPVDDPTELSSAVRRKLVLEIATLPARDLEQPHLMRASVVTGRTPRVDCGSSGNKATLRG